MIFMMMNMQLMTKEHDEQEILNLNLELLTQKFLKSVNTLLFSYCYYVINGL